MSMFCSENGLSRNPLCRSGEYYRNLYRVDSSGRQLPLSLAQLLNVDTFITGNLVFSANGEGRFIVIVAENADNVRNRGLLY